MKFKKLFASLLSAAALFVAHPAQSRTVYITDNGSRTDTSWAATSNPADPTTCYDKISDINSRVRPGDSVVVVSLIPADSTSLSANLISPLNSGTEANPIVYRNFNTIGGLSAWLPIPAVAITKNYIKISGFRLRRLSEGAAADTTGWDAYALTFTGPSSVAADSLKSVIGSKVDSCYFFGSNLQFATAHRCTLSNSIGLLTSDGMPQKGTIQFRAAYADKMEAADSTCTMDALINNVIVTRNIGWWYSGLAANGNRFFGIWDFTNHCYFRNNTFYAYWRLRDHAGSAYGFFMEECMDNLFEDNTWIHEGVWISGNLDSQNPRWIASRSGNRRNVFRRERYLIGLSWDSSKGLGWYSYFTQASGVPYRNLEDPNCISVWQYCYGDSDQTKWNTWDNCFIKSDGWASPIIFENSKAVNKGITITNSVIAAHGDFPFTIRSKAQLDSCTISHNTLYFAHSHPQPGLMENGSIAFAVEGTNVGPVQVFVGTGNQMHSNIFYSVLECCNYSANINCWCRYGQYNKCRSNIVQFWGPAGGGENFKYNLLYSPTPATQSRAIKGYGTDDSDPCYSPESFSIKNKWGDPLFTTLTWDNLDLHPKVGSPAFGDWPDGYVGAYPPQGAATCVSANGCQYFVNGTATGASNANDGLAPELVSGTNGPWRTISKANVVAQPKDIVFVYSINPADSGSVADSANIIYPERSGTSEAAPIQYISMAATNTTIPVPEINLLGRSYIKVSGFRSKGDVVFGDSSTSRRGIQSKVINSYITRDVYFKSAEKCTLQNSVIRKISFAVNSAHVIFQSNGAVVNGKSQFNLFEGNTLPVDTIGGGAREMLLTDFANNNIIRNNAFYFAFGNIDCGQKSDPAGLELLESFANTFSGNTWTGNTLGLCSTPEADTAVFLRLGGGTRQNRFTNETWNMNLTNNATGVKKVYWTYHTYDITNKCANWCNYYIPQPVNCPSCAGGLGTYDNIVANSKFLANGVGGRVEGTNEYLTFHNNTFAFDGGTPIYLVFGWPTSSFVMHHNTVFSKSNPALILNQPGNPYRTYLYNNILVSNSINNLPNVACPGSQQDPESGPGIVIVDPTAVGTGKLLTDWNIFYSSRNDTSKAIRIPGGTCYEIGGTSNWCSAYDRDCISLWTNPLFTAGDTVVAGFSGQPGDESAAFGYRWPIHPDSLGRDGIDQTESNDHYVGAYAITDTVPPGIPGLLNVHCSQIPNMNKTFAWTWPAAIDSVFIVEGIYPDSIPVASVAGTGPTNRYGSWRSKVIWNAKYSEAPNIGNGAILKCNFTDFSTVYWRIPYCGSDAVAEPGKEVAYYMVVFQKITGSRSTTPNTLMTCP